MVPRPAVRRERNSDYSAVGTAGRRTGVTLPQGKLDENGLEEITGLFSSPVKPSPVKSSPAKQHPGAINTDAQNSSGLTPTQTLSARRSLGAPALPPPRSTSPRKSGISGSARRSNGIDILSPSKAVPVVEAENQENSASPTPIRVKPRRFVPSPEKQPLKEVMANGEAVSSASTPAPAPAPMKAVDNSNATSNEGVGKGEGEEWTHQAAERESQEHNLTANGEPNQRTRDDDSVHNPMGDDEMEEFLSSIENTIQDASPVQDIASKSVEEAKTKGAESVEPLQNQDLHQKPAAPQSKGRKRKSGDIEAKPTSMSAKKPAKKPRATKAETSRAEGKQKVGPSINLGSNLGSSTNPAAVQAASQLIPPRIPGLVKDANTHLSQRQQAQLDQIIEKVKARPGKLKTLYVLKREKSRKSGADDVRSGRAVVKPLAYWNAEQCVHDEGGAAGLEIGARIPLHSIKEITKERNKTKKAADEDSSDDEDTNEEDWEKQVGVYRGQVNAWVKPGQTDAEDSEEMVDLAFHPSSMLTREVKDAPGFRFAKLISNEFLGSGMLDLAPGSMKMPKNSRTMHMCFFVFKGRVTVRIGAGIEEGECERFSVGKGGVFQVPRGNRYSIENELEKPARIFFSQASETAPKDER
ncbi:hypothetical protein GJ744_004998 [Endocarpon pusillum]|uniref:Mif2/CENP-C cupin domain-containing protein n=1 Tax=Endocarpon pusillum TaxID=364733 RepID=A0A8H7DZU3_9EURO|nr:hypothetical protein GJ744_004998 [Endocarpon pusillum]